jgi:hypothetical protein
LSDPALIHLTRFTSRTFNARARIKDTIATYAEITHRTDDIITDSLNTCTGYTFFARGTYSLEARVFDTASVFTALILATADHTTAIDAFTISTERRCITRDFSAWISFTPIFATSAPFWTRDLRT